MYFIDSIQKEMNLTNLITFCIYLLIVLLLGSLLTKVTKNNKELNIISNSGFVAGVLVFIFKNSNALNQVNNSIAGLVGILTFFYLLTLLKCPRIAEVMNEHYYGGNNIQKAKRNVNIVAWGISLIVIFIFLPLLVHFAGEVNF